MATAEQILAIARRELGAVEDRAGRQKYGAWYGMNGVAWCAIFTQWVFAQAGASALVPRTAYTPTYYQWFRDHAQATQLPAPGDLVFYDWPDSVNRIQHVGIVEAVEPAAIVTIEGNTTSGTAGNQSAGGGVWRRRRARNSSIVGYGRPRYETTSTARPPAEEDDMFTDQDRAVLARIATALERIPTDIGFARDQILANYGVIETERAPSKVTPDQAAQIAPARRVDVAFQGEQQVRAIGSLQQQVAALTQQISGLVRVLTPPSITVTPPKGPQT